MARLEIDVVSKGVAGLIAEINAIQSAVNGIKPIQITTSGNTKGLSADLVAARIETEKYRSAAAAARAEIVQLSLEKAKNANQAKTTVGAYREMSALLNTTRNDAKNLAAEMYNLEQQGRKNTPVYDALSKKFSDVSASANKLDGVLKGIDSSLGQHQRYVGNYERAMSGANGVTMEFNRIIQDAPFGMMGIGNNIQQLTANWGVYAQQVREANDANGKVTTTGGLLKGVLQNMISPFNLLTLGVSLATAGWVAYEKWQQKSNKAAKENIDVIAQQKQELDKYISSLTAVEKASAAAGQSYAKEITQLDILYSTINSSNVSRESQANAIRELQKLYPTVFGNLEQEAILADEGARAYDRLRASIIQTGIAQAARSLSEQASQDYVKNVVAQNEAYKSAQNELSKYNELIKLRNILSNESTKYLGQEIKLGGQVVKVQKDNSYEITRLNGVINQQYEITRKATEQSNGFGNAAKKASDEIKSYNQVVIDNTSLIEENTGIIKDIQKEVEKLESERPFLKSAEAIKKNVDRVKELKAELDRLEGRKDRSSSRVVNTVAKAIEDSNNRAVISGTEGREKEIQSITNWYSSRLSLAAKNNSALVILQDNMRKEIEAVNKKYDDKELADGKEFMQKRQDDIAKLGQQNAEQIKKDSIAETETSIVYQRRLFESRAQQLIRSLNMETKIKEDALSKWVKDEINSGKNIEDTQKQALDKRIKIQEDYYNKIEELSSKDRATSIITSFDGTAASIELASINSQMDLLKTNFEQSVNPNVDEFLGKISDLSLQREQLGLLNQTMGGITDVFGNFVGNVLTDTDKAFENIGDTVKNMAASIISDLAKIAIRQALNSALAKASIASTTLASTTAAAATTAAWTPAAAVSSVASFGGAVAAGAAALIPFLMSMKGFSSGGYTGNGGINDIAGVVHGKEYVINARATRDNLPLLRAINDGVDVSSLLHGTGVSKPIKNVVSDSRQRIDVVVHGEISNGVIKLSNDQGNQDFKTYFGK